jgi:epoxyqueuosine reductase
MEMAELSTQLKRRAEQLGFQLAGITPAAAPPGWPRLVEWLDRGFAGQMQYLADHRQAYSHPRHVLDGVRSLVLLGMTYGTGPPAPARPGMGRISRYAYGQLDYHDLIRRRLHQLADWLRDQCPGASVRGVVDTAPLMEREFGALAGLGWIGKHTLLLNRQQGSWFFLAALLTDIDLPGDAAWTTDHCGTCRACLDACPTQAFVAPYVLDARRCISYLTIELRGPIPSHLRSSMGEWLFGCDICQEVCPWNRKAPQTEEELLRPSAPHNPAELVELFQLTDDQFRARFRHTPMWRPHRGGLLRNAAIVLGNQRHAPAVPALIGGLQDRESLVRGACAWALGQMAGDVALQALADRRSVEDDPIVLEEIEQAIAGTRQPAGSRPPK